MLASHEGAGLKLHLGKSGVLPAEGRPIEAVASNGASEVLSGSTLQALERQNIEKMH